MSKVCSKCGVEKDDKFFRQRYAKCWDCRKEQRKIYLQSDTAKLSAKKTKEKHKVKIKNKANEKMKRSGRELTDRYVIEQLMNKRVKKPEYSTEYLKSHPEIIENKRKQILINRLKRKIETVSNTGFCYICKKAVPLSEFREQRATQKKRAHKQRMCNKCKKDYNKKYWEQTLKPKKKNEQKHNIVKKPSI